VRLGKEGKVSARSGLYRLERRHEFAACNLLLHLALVLFKRFTFVLCRDRGGREERREKESERVRERARDGEAEEEDDDPLPMTTQNGPTRVCVKTRARARALSLARIITVYRNLRQGLLSREFDSSFINLPSLPEEFRHRVFERYDPRVESSDLKDVFFPSLRRSRRMRRRFFKRTRECSELAHSSRQVSSR